MKTFTHQNHLATLSDIVDRDFLSSKEITKQRLELEFIKLRIKQKQKQKEQDDHNDSSSK
jgi:hypothetical protein